MKLGSQEVTADEAPELVRMHAKAVHIDDLNLARAFVSGLGRNDARRLLEACIERLSEEERILGIVEGALKSSYKYKHVCELLLAERAKESVRLDQTCGACPEQYDAFIGDQRVGYLRLRHGHFSVEWTCGDATSDRWELLYTAAPEGDGAFMDGEREEYLSAAKYALMERWEQEERRKT